VSNPDKILFPDRGYTKLDLARYYVAVADGALHAAGHRPNVLVRYPNGVGGEFFYQKRAPASRPGWIDSVVLAFPCQPGLPRAASASGACRRPRSPR
jgi:DNA primase